jgi:hypothetical protein
LTRVKRTYNEQIIFFSNNGAGATDDPYEE